VAGPVSATATRVLWTAVAAAALAAAAGGCSLGEGAGAEGGLEVSDAWAAETDSVAAVYLTIDNGGDGDRLVGAETGVAGDVSVMGGAAGDPSSHHTPAAGEPAVDLAVPPGRTDLAPGGRHVMLGELTRPLRPGDRIPLTLDFEDAGTRSVTVEILAWDQVVDRAPPVAEGDR
jgi:copper(I)-binding protein